ncbi:FAD-binding oxidoreductase [Desulfuribacillus alkaliarsenatis]|uniref:Uncharacterized protein n=1 Tax=Desulfuribacillus alkaliarsenatis TaxID=766136 RepID=A0A1E5G324_9FIRM|nr:FAD-binding oxidoreductase [Desulfuribacillus alkaliarsenatis]OEF97370.1 hypothetical protein BHF68_03940 [Desulfuribacillus alkaliarsenatis]
MFTKLINSFGKDYIDRHLQLLSGAINEIESASTTVEIDYEFSRRDTLYSASCEEDVASLLAEYNLLKQHGFELSFLTKKDIESKYPFSRPAATYGLPIIGIYDEYPNCYFLFGFGDNGTVYSQLLSKIIVEDIVEGSSPDIVLYLQDRPLLAKKFKMQPYLSQVFG